MRIAYKSVPITQAWSDGRVVTTVYDRAQVRSHVLDVPWSRIAFHGRYFGVAMLLWAVLAFALTFAKDYRVTNPIVLAGILAAGFGFAWFCAYALAFGQATEEHARQERGVPAETPLKIVEEKHWQTFVERLRRQNRRSPGSQIPTSRPN